MDDSQIRAFLNPFPTSDYSMFKSWLHSFFNVLNLDFTVFFFSAFLSRRWQSWREKHPGGMYILVTDTQREGAKAISLHFRLLIIVLPPGAASIANPNGHREGVEKWKVKSCRQFKFNNQWASFLQRCFSRTAISHDQNTWTRLTLTHFPITSLRSLTSVFS